MSDDEKTTKDEQPKLAFYKVTAKFLEEASIIVLAPSAEAAVSLVDAQYKDKLENFQIIGVEYQSEVTKEMGVDIH